MDAIGLIVAVAVTVFNLFLLILFIQACCALKAIRKQSEEQGETLNFIADSLVKYINARMRGK